MESTALDGNEDDAALNSSAESLPTSILNGNDVRSNLESDKEAIVSEQRKEIRGCWEFIAACQFLVLFQDGFSLESFNTRDFEEQLIKSCDRTIMTDDQELMMIHVKLLKTLYKSKTVNLKNWLEVLPGQFEKRKKIEQEWIEYRSYIGMEPYVSSLDEIGSNMDWSPELNYKDISLRHKILIIYCLCEWQFDNPDTFNQLIYTNESDAAWIWRMGPIGYDSTESFAYWHFHDHRLYKQSLPEKSETFKNDAEKWILVADKSTEWTEFKESLSGSRNRNDKKLYSYLSGVLEDVIPYLEEYEKECEKRRDYEDRVANAKKSFRIKSRELEKLEIQSLDFLQDFSQGRRSQRRRIKSPVLTIEEKKELQMKKQRESRSRRALERELKSTGLYDESIFSTDEGNTVFERVESNSSVNSGINSFNQTNGDIPHDISQEIGQQNGQDSSQDAQEISEESDLDT